MSCFGIQIHTGGGRGFSFGGEGVCRVFCCMVRWLVALISLVGWMVWLGDWFVGYLVDRLVGFGFNRERLWLDRRRKYVYCIIVERCIS